MIGSIMAATDGSEAAQAALAWSAQLARRRRAHLDVVHVTSMRQAEVTPELRDDRVAEARTHLDEWIVQAGAGGEADGRIVEVGQAAERIAERAERTHPDLLVLGARGSDGLTKLGLGSTAHQVVHDYHGPLAAVHELSELDDMTQVIVGVDGSDGSAGALRWAADLSVRLSTNPLAVLVHDPLADSYPHPDNAQWKYQHQAAVEQQIAAVDGCVDLRILSGDPVEELAAIAATFRSSILVVGTRSHGMAQHQFLGRVPMELLHHSRCPVVVITAT